MMLSRQEYEQTALSAELEDLRPTLLDAEQMRAKLAELGISADSALGRHALTGAGPLFSPAGEHYRLDTPQNLARAASGKQCCVCLETLDASDQVQRGAYGAAAHRECDGLSLSDARRVRAIGTPRANVSTTRAEAPTRIGTMIVRW